MEINFLCSNLSGRGGTETVLITVLNLLSADNKLTLTLVDIPQDQAWLKKLDPSIRIVMPKKESKFEKVKLVLQTFLTGEKGTIYISLSLKMIKIGAIIRRLLFKRYKIISWIHFSLLGQDMFDPYGYIQLADGHLAISRVIWQQLQELGVDRQKIKLIGNPVAQSEKIVLNEDKGQIRLFYAGRVIFSGQKNLKEMLDGIARVPNAFLTVYGSGEDEEISKKYAADLGIGERVSWKGWTEDVFEEIRKNEKPNALIMTSTFEGLPMIMLEALSHGIPIITSDFAGSEDIISEGINGTTYSQGNIDELAQKIVNIGQKDFDENNIMQSINQYYPENYLKRLNKAIAELCE